MEKLLPYPLKFSAIQYAQCYPHCRSVPLIDSECRQVNDKLRRLAAVLPDVASLSPLDYDCTSKRADVDVLQTLVESAKRLKVSK